MTDVRRDPDRFKRRRPDVTAVIPTKDRWPLLSRAVRSALWQEDVRIEVIVVDDGSSDRTSRGLAEIGDARLRVFHNASSRGVANARNVAVEHARADWIAFLDDDDLWAPRKLRTELDRAAGGANFIYTGMVIIDDEVRPRERHPLEPDELRRTLLYENTVGAPSTVMVRTHLVRAVGGFDERLSVLADWDLWIRLILDEGAIIAPCREPLVAYFLHPHNMHRALADSILAEFRHLAAKNSGRGQRFGGPPFFRWVATAQRRRGRRAAAARTYLEAAARYRSLGDFARGVGVLFGEPVMTLAQWQPQHPVLAQIPPWVTCGALD